MKKFWTIPSSFSLPLPPPQKKHIYFLDRDKKESDKERRGRKNIKCDIKRKKETDREREQEENQQGDRKKERENNMKKRY